MGIRFPFRRRLPIFKTMPVDDSFSLSLHKSIHEIDVEEWNACAGGSNPFVSHAFLSAVEDSGSADARTGWLPQHAVFRDSGSQIVGVVPMYVKSHSYGEYVFDHGWANAFERAGGSYYPKLQAAVPFSPVPGPRLLRRPGTTIPMGALGQGLSQVCEELALSSVHVTFCEDEEWQALGGAGWLQRIGIQYHWNNAGYGSFDDFLGAMSSRKRKTIRRERRDAQGAGLTFRTLRGHEITRPLWDAFFAFYQSTVDRKWGSAYLTKRFFPMLADRLGDRVVLMMAFHGETPVAAALNLVGADALYGRNWGCTGDWPFLHFELCYYQAIDFAIAEGLSRVEAGAQGEHKIQRGYLPSTTYSAHWIAHPGLRRAIAGFLDEERPAIRNHMEELATLSPFKDEG
jgi:uncharacterized protein